MFTQVPNTFILLVSRSLEASWRRCHSSSGFSLSQFVLFLHVMDDDDDDKDDDEIRSDLCVGHSLLSDSSCKQKSHWTITINGKINVWKYKLFIFRRRLTILSPFMSPGKELWSRSQLPVHKLLPSFIFASIHNIVLLQGVVQWYIQWELYTTYVW